MNVADTFWLIFSNPTAPPPTMRSPHSRSGVASSSGAAWLAQAPGGIERGVLFGIPFALIAVHRDQHAEAPQFRLMAELAASPR